MYSIVRENYQYYFIFLPALIVSAIVLPASSLLVLSGGLFLFLIRSRLELVIPTFITIIVMGDNLWDMFEIFKVSRVVILLFVFGISGLIILNKEEGIDPRINYFIPFWMITFISSLWFSNTYTESITRVFSYLFLVISVFTFFRYIYYKKKVAVTEHIFVITATILLICWAGMFTPINSWFYFSGRFMGIFGNPNTMALFLIMMYPMIDNLQFEDTRITKMAQYILLGFIVVSMVLTGSRNGLIALMIYIGGKMFLTKGFSGRSIAIAAVSLGLVLIINYETVSSHMPFIKDYVRVESMEGSTASGRTLAWAVAVDQIGNAPWLGNGLTFTDTYFQNFRKKHNLIDRYWNSVWNSYLAIMLEAGIIGLLGYLFFLFGLAKKVMTNKLMYPFLLAALFSAMFESWMISSLNVCTTLFLFNFIIFSDREQ